MKPSIILGAVSVLLGVACSAESGKDGGSGANGSGATGTGATSNVGATSNGVPGAGTGPMLEMPTAGSSGNGTGGSSPVDNGECAQQSVVIGAKPADVLLVLDRSKSMIQNTVPPNGETRWAAVVPALSSVITQTDQAISWGVFFYPEGEGDTCLPLSDTIPAPIMPKNAAAVTSTITATMALGNGTPTGDAIKKATAYLKSRNVSNQYIVLATDGEPSCPSGGDQAATHAVEAITAAKAAGYPTYVIGVLDLIEDDGAVPRLNAMAEAGGTALSDNPIAPKFFQAQSQEELTNALKTVTGQVVSCVFELTSKPPVPTNIAVSVNGTWLEQDATKAQGWDYTSDQYVALELHGDACQQVKTASENKVDIIFGCPGKPIIVPK